MTEKQRDTLQRVCAWLVVVMLALAGLYGACWLAWQGALKVAPNAARAWALGATALLPASVFVTWRLALRYAAGVVDGIGLGVGEVAKAGSDAANLRVHVHRELKRQPDQYAVLPEVEIMQRRLPSGGNVVEL